MEEKKYLDYQGLQTYHENLLSVLETSELATAEALDDLDDRLKIIENKSPYSKSEIDNLLEPITDKLNTVEEFAEVNVLSDWNQTDSSADDYIKNKPTSMPASDVSAWAKASSKPSYTKDEIGLSNVTNDALVKRSEMGTASGVATLDSAGKVPSSQLPSYVDDVLEYNTKSAFPATGESGKIYIDKSTDTTWRWSGTTYTQIKGDLAIGTTTGTAADGGIASAHYSNTSNPHGVTKAQVGLGSVVNTGDSATPVSGGTTKFTTGGAYTELAKKVDKVTGKGLSTNDYTTDEKNKLSGIASGAEVNQNAFSNVGVKVGNTTTTVAADAKTDTVTLIQGSNVTLTADTTNDTITIAATDTKNTAGTTNKTGTKMFLAAATEQGKNPVTYSNSNCYIGTDNCLYSGGTKVLTSHQVDALTRHTRLINFDLNVLKQAVTEQNLEKYGLKVGDQKTINGYTYVIADLNTMKGTVTPYRLTLNHVGLIVIPHVQYAWNSSGKTNTGANSRGAGYKNCDLHDYLKNTVLPHAKNDLGADNLLAHTKLLTNAVNTTGYNRFGKAEGCSSSLEWVSNLYISALSEVQVYGSTVWSSSGFDTGEACRLLEVFKKYSHTEIFGAEFPWLRDIASVTDASLVDNGGGAFCRPVSRSSCWVAGLLLFH